MILLINYLLKKLENELTRPNQNMRINNKRGGVILIDVSDKTCFNKGQMLQKSEQQQSHNDNPGDHADLSAFHRLELG